jgi:hypothetical protein
MATPSARGRRFDPPEVITDGGVQQLDGLELKDRVDSKRLTEAVTVERADIDHHAFSQPTNDCSFWLLPTPIPLRH